MPRQQTEGPRGLGGQTLTVNEPFIGRLPKAFIVAAFVNFIVGASFGGWMAVQPSAGAVLGQVHGEINPFGWLTMLIYGMTYAVLSIAAGLRPPKPWVGWLQLIGAQLGVIGVVVGLLLLSKPLLWSGLVLQFVAPVLFLANILSAVVSLRKAGAVRKSTPDLSLHPLSLLRRGGAYQATDRVGQRGTDVSAMLLLAGTAWMLVRSVTSPGTLPEQMTGALFLLYYGWIAGTIFAVALHMFPRFLGTGVSARGSLVAQLVWGVAVVVGVLGLVWSPAVAGVASRLLGLPFLWFGASYLWMFSRRRVNGQPTLPIPVVSRGLWWAAWVFCLVLGAFLIGGLSPFTLVAFHLLFLGFGTNLVYGIGYTLFPYVLHRREPPRPVAAVQAAGAIIGSLLMVVAFAWIHWATSQLAFVLLAVGGTLAALSAVAFLLMWLTSRRAV
ncbi:hypothetical protein [Alicyclobacillus sp. ALC3]|uniref:hypothetical protein n=1 Tax=Alicyclobacillus sp. ALC3 TaxID=2796143 RepID=UPI002378425C|nr:hypothetical protein [Alicyclobacillus sp. ALC3]WDL97545.1 hypothetical protein JC200_02100 [Alicyclobacillus sp. ALC3]